MSIDKTIPLAFLFALLAMPATAEPPLPLRAIRGGYDGVPVTGPLFPGEVMVLTAEVAHPVSDSPLASTLLWELLDANDSPVEGFFKKAYAFETGGSGEYTCAFRLDNLESGAYRVRLTREVADRPEKTARGYFPFSMNPPRLVSRPSTFGSNVTRTMVLNWSRTNDRGTTIITDGKMYLRNNEFSGEVNYIYMNIRGYDQVMTLHLSGRLDPATGRVNGTLIGGLSTKPMWGEEEKGTFTGTFEGAAVGGQFRGTWVGSSDVSFLFQTKHAGRWETR